VVFQTSVRGCVAFFPRGFAPGYPYVALRRFSHFQIIKSFPAAPFINTANTPTSIFLYFVDNLEKYR
jgi:hypothetical protein